MSEKTIKKIINIKINKKMKKEGIKKDKKRLFYKSQ